MNKNDFVPKAIGMMGRKQAQDVELVTDRIQLEGALRTDFQAVFVEQGSVQGILSVDGYSFGDLLKTLGTDYRRTGSVYDASAPLDKESRATRPTNVKAIEDAFLRGKRPAGPLNFLDIDNRSGIHFTPREVIEVDLLRRVNWLKARGGFGKDADRRSLSAEWFIASTEGSVSPFHVDNAGCCTWMLILQG